MSGPPPPPPGFRMIARLDDRQLAELHALYQDEWWSRGRALDDVRRMLAHSDLVFGLAREASGSLAAFARVLTDRVYKALVFDLIVAPDFRGLGLGKALIQAILPYYRRWGFREQVGGVRFLRRQMER